MKGSISPPLAVGCQHENLAVIWSAIILVTQMAFSWGCIKQNWVLAGRLA